MTDDNTGGNEWQTLTLVLKELRAIRSLLKSALPEQERGPVTQSDTQLNPGALRDLYEALDELADIMRGVMHEGYKPDSFTLQPADAALAKAREPSQPEREKG